MPYAFVAHVQFAEGADPELGRKMLQEGVIPAAKAQAGFQSGIWVRSPDEKSGIGTIVFDTKANAEAGMAALQAGRPAEAPAITDSGIYEVMAQA
jgi:hypothetical protein